MRFVKLREEPQWREKVVDFFCSHWSVSREEYLALTDLCIRQEGPIPQFYIAVCGTEIVAGTDIQHNDEHDRPDLSPNICDVYVDEAFRRKGIAGELLAFAETDMRSWGIPALYLLTELDGFYERYGWERCAMAHWFWLGGKLSKVYRKML